MYNLGDDNELDRISREAAGRYTPPGQADWQSLSEELDRVMPQEKKRRFIFWWILPALLAGGGAVYVINQEIIQTKKEVTSIQPTKENSEKISETGNAEQQPTVVAISPVQNKTEQKSTTSLPSENSVTGMTSFKQQKVTKRSAQHNGASLLGNSADQQLTKLNEASTNKSVQDQTPLVKGSSANNIEPISEKSKPEEKEVTKEKQPSTETIAKTESKPAIEEVEESKAVVTPRTNKTTDLPKRGKGLSFAILAGVDKSTVKFTHGEKAGYNVGMEVAYHFNDKWAIKTGAIYTQKNYKLNGEDFTAPKGTPVSYYNLDLVEGYCKMWEIPLTASYTLSSRGKHAITLNSGLSSYFMKNEEYNYYYQYNGNPVVRNANYNSTDTHILSILHFSAGFENRIGKNSSLIIEPYAKLPLGGVGFGSIKLSSFGVNFSMQLRQPTKK